MCACCQPTCRLRQLVKFALLLLSCSSEELLLYANAGSIVLLRPSTDKTTSGPAHFIANRIELSVSGGQSTNRVTLALVAKYDIDLFGDDLRDALN
jgi:hypothetical protein